MDQALVAFRKAAAGENRGRHVLQRRYSGALRAQAVAYWQARRRHGDQLRVVAAALGVAPWSLHRWSKAARYQSRFHSVHVVTPIPAASVPSLVITFPTIGARVEGLDLNAAAQLFALLR